MQVTLRFTLALTKEDSVANGPLFHRWIPDGERDAIELPPLSSPDPGPKPSRLRVWFDPRGGDFGGLHYAPEGPPFPREKVEREGKAEGGPLHGELQVDDVDDAAIQALDQDSRHDPAYEALGRIVYKAIHVPISNFVLCLKHVYGQSWLQPPDHATDRRGSLANYFANMGVKWRVGDRSGRFRPGTPVSWLKLTALHASEYRQYLKRAEWDEIPDLLCKWVRPPAATEVLSRAARMLLEEEVRSACVEAYAGLELALSQYVESRNNDPVWRSLRRTFDAAKMEQKLALVAAHANIQSEAFDHAIEGLEARHRVAHKGWIPTESEESVLAHAVHTLIEVAASLLPAPGMRVLRVTSSTTNRSPEQWEARYDEFD